MDIKSFKTFQAVVKHGSFIRAAEALNYAQSTVTMQVQKLEADYGVQLIERGGIGSGGGGGGKSVRLTEAGRLFYEQSLDIVQRAESMQRGLTGLQLGEAGHIRLGATEPAASYRLPETVEAFLAAYPQVRISIDIAGTPALSAKLIAGELDLALCSSPGLAPELYFEPLYEEPFVVVLPARHPLAERAAITPQDFGRHRLLITAPNCPYRKQLEAVLQETGQAQADTMEIGSMTALRPYVAQGLGIALMPRIVAEKPDARTVVRPLEGDRLIAMTMGLLFRSAAFPPGMACANLYQALRSAFSSAKDTAAGNA